ncbi:microsomal glutathione S-transferase 1-like isoform X2 [Euwallacea similis]|uniref:microsomal glutathione S-transferase 1-like isoform X2 n=1 Tax=Euwallacea similis TaxID=1736056 RepID=UPI00344BDD4E
MSTTVFEGLVQQPIFRTYAFYVALLGLKMLAMSGFTGIQRMKNLAFANAEDAQTYKLKPKVHEDVERVRRAHLNDLENIPIFFIVSLVYLTTNPSLFLASTLIQIFTVARFIHTFVYAVIVIPQPARALSWGTGYFITIYMAVCSLLHYL